MNETIKALFDRKSIRAFQNKPIPESDRDLLLECAIQAPTAGNQVFYTILEIEDQDIKEKLAVLCDNQPFIATAPFVLIFLADNRKWLDCYMYAKAESRNPRVGDLLLSCEDALIAAQNTVIAAHSLGIGSCYIGDILENKEKVVELLSLDKYVIPITMLVFGYPTEQQMKTKKPRRFNKKYIVKKNKYSRLSENEIRSMFSEINPEMASKFDESIKAFCKFKYTSEFSLEMSRSSEEYLKSFYDE
jgi:nitroreductase